MLSEKKVRDLNLFGMFKFLIRFFLICKKNILLNILIKCCLVITTISGIKLLI